MNDINGKTRKELQTAELKAAELTQLRNLKVQAFQFAMQITGGRPLMKQQSPSGLVGVESPEPTVELSGTENALAESRKIFAFFTEEGMI